ncbi:hypothetical protein PPERSA_03968 [Pseudocohnilembus persalinus]|uniref:Peptidase S45, penicillin amidase n=1 Tax=Pseudocohnilembus persalinus TaxID=266149 RepID=A0A0V0QAL7_PSEPJ|nr:hypothetical protein PPERSA_03968 [Pseudocohnilembus persalinus]|eukprot:KRW99262.1 hypothetical protein PPERSA_03968 [Pseudocohnilembus persalinus]
MMLKNKNLLQYSKITTTKLLKQVEVTETPLLVLQAKNLTEKHNKITFDEGSGAIKLYGNPCIKFQEMRAALYHHLGVDLEVEEEYLEWDKKQKKVQWETQIVKPKENKNLLQNPTDFIEKNLEPYPEKCDEKLKLIIDRHNVNVKIQGLLLHSYFENKPLIQNDYCLIFITIVLSIVISFTLILYITSTSQYNGIQINQHEKYGRIEIKRDEQGIPHILGKDKPSAFYGLGYSECQDRLWQMEYKRYVGYGKLSSLFGEKAIPVDIFMKTIGVEKSAIKALEAFKDEDLQILQAYIDGINDCANQLPYLPLEFWILGLKFQNWTLLDSVVTIEYMAISFAYNYQFESINDRLREIFEDEFVIKFCGGTEPYFVFNTTILDDQDLKKVGLFQEYKGDLQKDLKKAKNNIKKVALEEFQSIDKLWEETKDFYPEQIYGKESGFGSNSWAVSGKFTESGKPLLSADPHLLHNIPNFWYQSEIVWGDEKKNDYIIGAHVPGSVDSTDYFEVKLNDDQTKYLHDDKWLPLKIRTEFIQVKGKEENQEVEIKYTHHGPLLNIAINNFAKNPLQNHEKTTALAWSGFQDEHETSFNFYKLSQQKTLKNVQFYLKNLDKFGLSIVFATADNHIGFYSTGRLPIRKNPKQGLFIQDGTNSENNWMGFTKPDELANILDPNKGYIVASNNRISSSNIIYHNQVTHNFNQSRAKRITDIFEQHLKSGKKFNEQIFQSIHSDVIDPVCQDTFLVYVEIVEKYLDKYEWKFKEKEFKYLKKTIQFVKEDENRCFMSKDKFLPTIYVIWQKKLKYLLFDPEFLQKKAKQKNPEQVKNIDFYQKLQHDYIANSGYNVHFHTNLVREWGQNLKNNYEKDYDFCENQYNKNVTGNKCYYDVILALFQTLDYIKINQVQTYGQLHQRTFKHQPFSNVPILNRIFERSIPASGTGDTPNVGPLDDNFKSIYSCNFRAVFNMDEKGKNYWILDTGVSGNPFSPHYADQMNKFAQGEFYEMKFGYKNFLSMKAKYKLVIENKIETQKSEF